MMKVIIVFCLLICLVFGQNVIDESNVDSFCTSSNINEFLCKGDTNDVCNTDYFICTGESKASEVQSAPEGMVCFEGELISTFTECLTVELLDDEDEDDNLEAEPTQSGLVIDENQGEEGEEEDSDDGSSLPVVIGAAAGGIVFLAAAGLACYKAVQVAGGVRRQN
eukprot:Awhi_evm1s3635